MGFSKRIVLLNIILFIVFVHPVSAQIIFKELPNYQAKISDSSFFDITPTRKVILLNGEWRVYPADKKKSSASVVVPSIFEGESELIFEKTFTVTQNELNHYSIVINFLGLNYSADISLNNIIIYRHTGGEFPFDFELPHDILIVDKKNIFSVKLFYKLDSENTIPVKQRFLFPQSFGGIFRDVYIHLIPKLSITGLNLSDEYDPKSNKAVLKINSEIENKEFKSSADSLVAPENFNLKLKIFQPDGASAGVYENKFTLGKNKKTSINQNIEIKNPLLWSFSNPQKYKISAELWRNDSLVDLTKKELGIYSLTAEKDYLRF